MPSDTETAALYGIRDNIRLAKTFVETLTYEQFRVSPLHVYGVTRALEIHFGGQSSLAGGNSQAAS